MAMPDFIRRNCWFGFLVVFVVCLDLRCNGRKGFKDDEGPLGRQAYAVATASVATRTKNPSGFATFEQCSVQRHGMDYTVSGWVDSENFFGAKVRTPFDCDLLYTNGAFSNVSVRLSLRHSAPDPWQ